MLYEERERERGVKRNPADEFLCYLIMAFTCTVVHRNPQYAILIVIIIVIVIVVFLFVPVLANSNTMRECGEIFCRRVSEITFGDSFHCEFINHWVEFLFMTVRLFVCGYCSTIFSFLCNNYDKCLILMVSVLYL